jgi:hypothetical protein
MHGMACYTKATMERAMKVQEVILRAIARRSPGRRGFPPRPDIFICQEQYFVVGPTGHLKLILGTDLPNHGREKEDVTLCETRLFYVTAETR